MNQFQYDDTLMFAGKVGRHGIAEKSFKKMFSASKAAYHRAHALLDGGGQGFVKNLSRTSHETSFLRAAQSARKQFDQLLVIGIGGSDLGARALNQALAKQNQKYRVHFLGDTVDPYAINSVFQKVNWKRCLINPVSKSGGTVETLAVFSAAVREAKKHLGSDLKKHVMVTTEENDGILHRLAVKEGYAVLPHPKEIGGRWSILSSVGLFSASFAGIDAKQLRQGAAAFYRQAKKDSHNVSMRYAVLHALGVKQGMSMAVLMPYESRLESFGHWYRQLFGESLGKAKSRKGKQVHVGITPVVAMGPRDQHSQIQLYNEGPFDKLVTFLTAGPSASLKVPKLSEELSFLSGKSFHEILLAEQRGTALALAKHKRPNGQIHLKQIDAHALGQLIMFFELACVYLAELFDIDAFDQPGVEEGKKQMIALLKA